MKQKKIIMLIICSLILLVVSGCNIPTKKPESVKVDITVGKIGGDSTIKPVDTTDVNNLRGFSEFVISHEDFVKMEYVKVENAKILITVYAMAPPSGSSLKSFEGTAKLMIKYIDKESVPTSYFTNNDRAQPINKLLLTNQFDGWKSLGEVNVTSSATQSIIDDEAIPFTQEVINVVTQDPNISSDKTYYFMFSVDPNTVWDYGIKISSFRVNMTVTKKL